MADPLLANAAKPPFPNVIPPEVAAAIRGGLGGDANAAPPPLPTGDAVASAEPPPQSVLDTLVSSGTTPPAPAFVSGQPHVTAAPSDALGDVVGSLVEGSGAKPALAPPPKPSLGDKIRHFLPYAGALGGALEAGAGPVGKAPVGAEMLQQSLAAQRAAAMESRKLEEVEKPKAKAYADYMSGKNETAENVAGTRAGSAANVQGLKNTGGFAIQGLKNAGAMDVQMLRAQIALGKVSRVLPGLDENGNPGMNAYNAQGKFVGRVEGALPPAAYLPKETATDVFMPDETGVIQRLRKGTSTAPLLPTPGTQSQAAPPPLAPLGTQNATLSNQGNATPTSQGGTVSLPQPRPASRRTVTNPSTGGPMKPLSSNKTLESWVTWDENGRTVAGPLALAQQNGAQNPATLPTMEVRDVQNARHAINLMMKTGDPNKPETNGVLQLIDSLDKDGKLGILASRWNKFMTTGVGTTPSDDPRIITLINKNMLGDTATMLAHFGASGGRSPLMLQHFKDLADAGKMDGVTLRAGVKAMADYMSDRAMLPAQKAASAQGGHTINYNNAQYRYNGSGDTADIKNYTLIPKAK